MFTNGHHHSSTHVAQATAQCTNKKNTKEKRENGRYQQEIGDLCLGYKPCYPNRAAFVSSALQVLTKTHNLLAFIYTQATRNISRQEITPFCELKNVFRMEIDEKAAGAALNFYFTRKKRQSKEVGFNLDAASSGPVELFTLFCIQKTLCRVGK